jgi:uncharacterized integral membrane protein
MPWRLVIYIAIFALFLVFVAFNLENRCDISFGFGVLEQVPVFITIFTSFVLGLLGAIPLVLHLKKKMEIKKIDPKKDSKKDTPILPTDGGKNDK